MYHPAYENGLPRKKSFARNDKCSECFDFYYIISYLISMNYFYLLFNIFQLAVIARSVERRGNLFLKSWAVYYVGILGVLGEFCNKKTISLLV